MIIDFEEGRNPNPVYFYCARNSAEPERANPEAILRSLVRQMSYLQPGGAILKPVQDQYDKRMNEGFADGPLSIEDCEALILELTKHRPLTTIVIDALDECDSKKRGILLQTLSTIVHKSIGLVKLFVSSREDRDIVLQLVDYPNLAIQANHNQDDIVKFVDSEVDNMVKFKRLLSGKVEEALVTQIKKVLSEEAQGMLACQSHCSFIIDGVGICGQIAACIGYLTVLYDIDH